MRPKMVTGLAQEFGIKGKTQVRDNIHVTVQNKKMLTVYAASGAFSYADHAKLNHPAYRPELPADDAAVKIAREYLASRGWLPTGAVLAGVQRAGVERVEGKKREKRTTVENHVCVDFRLQIGGAMTYGPGAKIKVFIGHRGEIIGLFHACRDAGQGKSSRFRARTNTELSRILSSKLGVPLDSIKVKDAQLAHYAESCVLGGQFMQPVHVFRLAATIKTARSKKPALIEFETHPIPATTFAPIVTIKAKSSPLEIRQDEPLKLACTIEGGTKPYRVSWESSADGHLGDGPVLTAERLSVVHRDGIVFCHTIRATVVDRNGMQDSHCVLVKVLPREGKLPATPRNKSVATPGDPYVGVEWCNHYHGSAPEISGTDPSAKGFKNALSALPGWSSRFDWGNDAAWEEDFKTASAPGGGTDSYWADNVHFAFFAGHGSPGAFYFGSTRDDHQMAAADARWGDGILNWIALHACQTMQSNFAWDVWCDAFKGLHNMFGFHTTTEGSTPPLGARFGYWMTFRPVAGGNAYSLIQAWRLACMECFDSSVEFSYIYTGQSGIDTYNDHLPGFGPYSSDPTHPNFWAYSKGTC